MNNIPRYKIVLVGNANVGKSTFANHWANPNYIFSNIYTPTVGVDVHPILFNTNHGFIMFNLWDLAGDNNYAGMRGSYIMDARGVIIMYDMTNEASLEAVDYWKSNIINIIGDNIPIDIYGTKSDLVNISNESTISVKNLNNLNTPFANLARKVTGYDDLILIPHIYHNYS